MEGEEERHGGRGGDVEGGDRPGEGDVNRF